MNGEADRGSRSDPGPGRARRTTARVAAGVLTVFWGWLFFGLQDFATPMVNGQEFAVHYLMETGWGLLFLVLVAVPLAALVVRPGAAGRPAHPGARVQRVPRALGAVLAGSGKHLLPALGLVASVAVLGLLGEGRPFAPLGRPAPVSTLLALLALVPAAPYAWHMAGGTRAPEYTWGLDHYPVQAAFAVALVLTALLAATSASRHEWVRWLPALTAAFSAAWMGVLSTLWPHRQGSFGTTWGWAAVAWAAAFVLAVAVEGRVADRA